MVWHLPEDLRFFRSMTLGHHVLLGRKTCETFGADLNGRKIILLTRNQGLSYRNATIVNSLEEGIGYARVQQETELFICGGQQVYIQAIHFADRMYLTHVDCELEGDRFFPLFHQEEWNRQSLKQVMKDHDHAFSFEIFEYNRKS